MPATMHVEFVAADRELWSGEATVVNTKTLAGEIGVMAHHQPLLSVLAEGQVDVRTVDDGHWVAAIDGGFISVADNRVSILCEHAEMSHESDFEEAKRKLEAAMATEAEG
ncbi:MAG TPA: F0F1 ATP synthase subunit epsilon [Nocardioidaceae bacterium]|nr:F0F1 ATP synthase subunit epsilon [Nocardioidaceae bacterium]